MTKKLLLLPAILCLLPLVSCERIDGPAADVPFTLDHGRLLVTAEMRRADGSWRPVKLWVDTGNPDFFLSGDLARDLGYDLSAAGQEAGVVGARGRPPLEVQPPRGLRLGGLELDCTGVATRVMQDPFWLFATMHNDANLPSSLLQRYRVVVDYPAGRLILDTPGTGVEAGAGLRAGMIAAKVHPGTGIVSVPALVAGDTLVFALDLGASYSFTDETLVEGLAAAHPDWPLLRGACGWANIWGWWPGEAAWPVLRLPEVAIGAVALENVGLAGLPAFFPGGEGLGAWYSRKTAEPVVGFLGPNAFGGCRLEIDYAAGAIGLERVAAAEPDLDLVGLTLRLEPDGGWRVLGVAQDAEGPAVDGIEPGDLLLRVDDLEVTGKTMGTVVDALRGAPGDTRGLVLARDGREFKVLAFVKRLL